MVTVYHNPRCTTSREVLEILKKRGEEIKIVKYLVDPPTYEEMKEILRKLNLRPMYLLRKEEDLYKKNFKGKYFTDDQWTRILIDNPILIQRPVVVRGNMAVVARPPKRVYELFESEKKKDEDSD